MSPSATVPARRSAALVLALCWTVVLLDGMDLNVYGAVMPYMLGDHTLGLTAGTAGTVGSWTTFGMLIGALVAGNVTDRVGRRPVVAGCVLVFAAGSALCATAPTAAEFGAGRLVAGLGLGGVMPTCLALAMEFAPAGRAALSTGVLMTSYHVGGMIATVLGLVAAPSAGWRLPFWIATAASCAVLPVLLRLLPESPTALRAMGRERQAAQVADAYGIHLAPQPVTRFAGGRAPLRGLLDLVRGEGRRATSLLWAASFCGLLLVYGVSTWLPQLMRASGYGLTSSVGFLFAINAGGVVGMLIAGRVAERFGPARVSAAWFVLTAAGSLLLAFHLPLLATYAVVSLTGVWLFSAQVMVYATAGRAYPPGQRAAGLGWTTGIGRFGAVVGPALGGAVVAGGREQWGFVTFAAAGLVGALAVAALAGSTGARAAGPAPTAYEAERAVPQAQH
ncbi:MFS transporter [Streptomyces sp. VRA16 Mangrove soil]|uniref:MFS transporter n=1 Tax=Streptomyces sp. VRA16 Mangrove soil TaxID=2817434 RepID=UPI001A9F5D69|nr:MFS transporter [Streptomyces sp. VRA16 Mangrove soil]MBO1337169.1 MFS transporter [Streptomyces sp. VRA16 Mangrove soil]